MKFHGPFAKGEPKIMKEEEKALKEKRSKASSVVYNKDADPRKLKSLKGETPGSLSEIQAIVSDLP